jgi:predicted DNA binding CopG/RHH family protein
MRKRAEPIPTFASEAEERRFWESRDSTQYVDWSAAERVRLPNLKPSTTSISLRLPISMLERIKVAAHKRDVPYQSLIKTWLVEKLDANSRRAMWRPPAPSAARSSGAPGVGLIPTPEFNARGAA